MSNFENNKWRENVARDTSPSPRRKPLSYEKIHQGAKETKEHISTSEAHEATSEINQRLDNVRLREDKVANREANVTAREADVAKRESKLSDQILKFQEDKSRFIQKEQQLEQWEAELRQWQADLEQRESQIQQPSSQLRKPKGARSIDGLTKNIATLSLKDVTINNLAPGETRSISTVKTDLPGSATEITSGNKILEINTFAPGEVADPLEEKLRDATESYHFADEEICEAWNSCWKASNASNHIMSRNFDAYEGRGTGNNANNKTDKHIDRMQRFAKARRDIAEQCRESIYKKLEWNMDSKWAKAYDNWDKAYNCWDHAHNCWSGTRMSPPSWDVPVSVIHLVDSNLRYIIDDNGKRIAWG